MKKLLLTFLALSLCLGLSAQCTSSKSRSSQKKTSSQYNKAKTTTYIYTYQKGPTTPKRKKQEDRFTRRPDRRPDRRPQRSSRQPQNRLMLAVGAGPNYTLDPDPNASSLPKGEEGSSAFEWNRDLMRPQGNVFIGYRFDQRDHKRANVIGVWGNAGLHSDLTLGRIMAKQQQLDQLSQTSELQPFTEWEAGLLLREWFRLSGGQGSQQVVNLNGEAQNIRYNIATLGFHIPLGRTLSWNTTASLLFGQDFHTFTFRPATGIGLRFNMLRI
jgi:hypothetical protein